MPACPFDLEKIDLDDVEPFEGELQELPDKVKECEKSVREDNPDLTKSEAIAICRDQLDMSLSDPQVYQLAGLETEPIEREELGDGKVAYRNLKILQSGVWTDSSSRETIWYSPRGLENLEVAEDNVVNIAHDDDNEVSEIGQIEPGSVRAEDGSLYADVIVDTGNSAGQYADENLQKTLETQGAKGFGGPSVEISPQGQQVEYNSEKGMKELTAGLIDGLGLVMNPASKPVSFARQTANRGVAMSADSQEVMVLKSEQRGMNPEDTAQVLSAFDAKELQGPEEVQEEAQAIADELDVPVGDVMEVLDPLFDMGGEDEGEDGDGEEEGEEMEEDEDGENEGEGEEDDDGEEDEMDMETKVESLEERLQNVEDMVEQAMMSEDLADAKSELADAETVKELSEAKEELEKRLSDLEGESKNPRSLSEDATESEDEIEGTVTYAGEYDSVRGAYSR